MADDDQTPPRQPPLPPLPEAFQIPIQLLEQWVEIPSQERLQSPLTRQDLDHLFFGLLRGSEAQSALGDALLHWSHNNMDGAGKSFAEFRRLNIESTNQIRQFMTAIMVSAVRTRHGK